MSHIDDHTDTQQCHAAGISDSRTPTNGSLHKWLIIKERMSPANSSRKKLRPDVTPELHSNSNRKIPAIDKSPEKNCHDRNFPAVGESPEKIFNFHF